MHLVDYFNHCLGTYLKPQTTFPVGYTSDQVVIQKLTGCHVVLQEYIEMNHFHKVNMYVELVSI